MSAKHPAAFINAIADEGTKAEAVEWLQKTWDDLQDAQSRLDLLTTREANGMQQVAELEDALAEAELERNDAYNRELAERMVREVEQKRAIEAESRLGTLDLLLKGIYELARDAFSLADASTALCQIENLAGSNLASGVETPSFIAKALGGENQVLKHLLKKESE